MIAIAPSYSRLEKARVRERLERKDTFTSKAEQAVRDEADKAVAAAVVLIEADPREERWPDHPIDRAWGAVAGGVFTR